MSVQFNRQYEFSAGKGSNAFRTTELHISFDVQKADTETPNTAKISLWNLSKPHLEILNSKDCVVMLRAGYGKSMPLIFTGAITHIETILDNADTQTELEAVDGRVELRDTFISVSYSGIVNIKKIIDDIAMNMGVTVTYSHNAAFSNIYSGFSSVGTAKQALDRLCTADSNSWSIQNGILQVKRRGDVMSRNVYVLSADSGLVGIPKRITEGAENSSAEPKSGWEISFLLNGAIGVSDFVKLETKAVSGYFRVYSIAFKGDNLSGDWLSTAKLYEV